MSGWAPAAPAVDPSVKIPEGMAVAGMGRRIGAWILDGIFTGIWAASSCSWSFRHRGGVIQPAGVGPVRGVRLRPVRRHDGAAHRRQHDHPDRRPGRLHGHHGALFRLAVAGLGRLSGSEDAGPARRRRLDRGEPQDRPGCFCAGPFSREDAGSSGLSPYSHGRLAGPTPTNEWLTASRYGSTTTTSFGPGGASTLLSYSSILWSILLVIVTGIDKMKRGWHDKVVRLHRPRPDPVRGLPPRCLPGRRPGLAPAARRCSARGSGLAAPGPGLPAGRVSRLSAPGPGLPAPASRATRLPRLPGYPPQAQPPAPGTPPPVPPAAPPVPPAEGSSDKPAGS